MTKKVIAKEKAYYGGNIIKPGDILTIKDDIVPSWAKETGSRKTEAKAPQAQPSENENRQQTLIPPVETVSTVETANNNDNKNISAELDSEAGAYSTKVLSGKTEEELNTILDNLITKGLELNVYLENTEGKSVIDQIQELDTEIKKKTEENKEG